MGDIKEGFRKAFLSVVGAAAVTAEKTSKVVEELADKSSGWFDELVKKGEITVEEGKKLVKEMQDKAEAAQGEFGQKIKTEVENVASKMGYVKKEDFEQLKKEFEDLKGKMSQE